MSWSDIKQIGKGILILFTVIILGVMAAEKQINNLTEYHEFVQAFSIQANANQSYSLYFLGNRYTILSQDTATELKEVVEAIKQQSTSGKIHHFFAETKTWCIACRHYLITSAYQGKLWLEDKWQEFIYEIESY